MGLDMYMTRYPRYKELGADEITKIDAYFAYRDKPYYTETPPAEDIVKYFEDKVKITYPEWDNEKRCPRIGIGEEVGYWRKANSVHAFFVREVQNDEDDCGNYEVSEDTIQKLKEICQEILSEAVLVAGKVTTGYHLNSGKWEPIQEDGFRILDDTICEELLPTESGFFFGSTDYDQYYLDDIRYTYELCCKLLKETDFANQMLVYSSSW